MATDLVTWRGTGSLALGRNDGAGNFVFEAVAGSSLKVVNQLAVGDLDGDGKLDVATIGVDVIDPDAVTRLAIAFGNGTGGIAEERVVPLAATGPILRVVDFDGNGRRDVAVTGPGGAQPWGGVTLFFACREP